MKHTPEEFVQITHYCPNRIQGVFLSPDIGWIVDSLKKHGCTVAVRKRKLSMPIVRKMFGVRDQAAVFIPYSDAKRLGIK